MLHAFKLGPIEVGKERLNVYAAVGPNGISRPAFEKSDANGLRALAKETRGEVLRCEPALATAAKKLGLGTGPLPGEALAARAGLAVALAMGPMGVGGGALATMRLLAAFAAFWRARPWERFDGDEPLPLTLAAGGHVSGREASVMGMGGEQFGIALYEKPGSVKRLGDLVRRGRFAEARKVAAVAVTIDPEPEYAVRAVEEAYGVPGVPIPLATGTAKGRAASPEEMLSLAAALEAVAGLMPRGREASAVAEAGALKCEVRVTVASAPEPAQAPSAGPPAPSAAEAQSGARTPRNAPCPCGSGKKYKKCHLAKDEAAAASRSAETSEAEARRVAERDPFHELDNRMVEEVLDLARKRWGRRFDPGTALAELGLDESAAQLLVPWCAFNYDEPDGLTALDLLDSDSRRPLSAEEKDWRDAQRVACFSILEVTKVEPGATVEVRDVLTGARHLVQEVSGSKTLVVRDVVLARVAEYRGKAFFCGMHTRSLPPREGATAVRMLGSELEVRAKRVPLDRLRDAADDGTLFVLWEQVVAALDRRPPPKLQNTDGEPLLFTTDHFTLAPGAQDEVRGLLLSLPGAHADEDGDGRVTFSKAGNALHRSWETTILGSATLEKGGLRVEANSVERADRLRALVEEVCGPRASFRAREHSDPVARVRGSAAAPPPSAPPDPAQTAALVEFKARHYRDWLDGPIPALGGLTPREAARRRGKARTRLELTLAEMEHSEARLPPEERFDVGQLRRELGLPEP